MDKFETFLLGCCTAAIVFIACDADAIEQDKKEHAIGSAAIAAVTAPILAGTDHPILYPFAVSFSAGVVKELYDSRNGGTGFSTEDLAADALGAIVGAVTGNAIYVFSVNRGIGIGVHGNFSTSNEQN